MAGTEPSRTPQQPGGQSWWGSAEHPARGRAASPTATTTNELVGRLLDRVDPADAASILGWGSLFNDFAAAPAIPASDIEDRVLRRETSGYWLAKLLELDDEQLREAAQHARSAIRRLMASRTPISRN
jgi:hypothetical protein